MQMKNVLFTLLTVTLIGGYTADKAFALGKDETVKEKAEEAANDTKRATKKAVRKVKDETCEMVDGKMKCMGKKIKHAAQNAGDKIEDAVD